MSEELSHHGVKGMRWGHRKVKDLPSKSGASKGPAEPPRKTRKEVRQINREGRAKFIEDKMHNMIVQSNKHPEGVLVSIVTPHSTYPTVVTGKEFVAYLAAGGAFNAKASDIFAVKDEKAGKFVVQERTSYQKVKR